MDGPSVSIVAADDGARRGGHPVHRRRRLAPEAGDAGAVGATHGIRSRGRTHPPPRHPSASSAGVVRRDPRPPRVRRSPGAVPPRLHRDRRSRQAGARRRARRRRRRRRGQARRRALRKRRRVRRIDRRERRLRPRALLPSHRALAARVSSRGPRRDPHPSGGRARPRPRRSKRGRRPRKRSGSYPTTSAGSRSCWASARAASTNRARATARATAGIEGDGVDPEGGDKGGPRPSRDVRGRVVDDGSVAAGIADVARMAKRPHTG